jgi:hypothetical protein
MIAEHAKSVVKHSYTSGGVTCIGSEKWGEEEGCRRGRIREGRREGRWGSGGREQRQNIVSVGRSRIMVEQTERIDTMYEYESKNV